MKWFVAVLLLACSSVAAGKHHRRQQQRLFATLTNALTGSGSGSASASGSVGIAISGDLATDVSQTLGLASSLAANADQQANFAAVQDLLASNQGSVQTALSQMANYSGNNVDGLSRFLNLFATDLVKGGNELGASVVNLVNADIAFKRTLINSLVDLFKGGFGNATAQLEASLNAAGKGLIDVIQAKAGVVDAVLSLKMNLLMDLIVLGNPDVKAAMVTGLAKLSSANLPITPQSLLTEMSKVMSGAAQTAAKATLNFFAQIGEGAKIIIGAKLGLMNAIGTAIYNGVTGLFGTFSGIAGGSGSTSGSTGGTGTGAIGGSTGISGGGSTSGTGAIGGTTGVSGGGSTSGGAGVAGSTTLGGGAAVGGSTGGAAGISIAV